MDTIHSSTNHKPSNDFYGDSLPETLITMKLNALHCQNRFLLWTNSKSQSELGARTGQDPVYNA